MITYCPPTSVPSARLKREEKASPARYPGVSVLQSFARASQGSNIEEDRITHGGMRADTRSSMAVGALGSGLDPWNKLRGTDRELESNQGLTPDMTTKSSTSPHLVSDSSEIATPALLIDLPTVERNVRQMAEYVRSHGLGLRPHIKTHKSLP